MKISKIIKLNVNSNLFFMIVWSANYDEIKYSHRNKKIFYFVVTKYIPILGNRKNFKFHLYLNILHMDNNI